MRIASRMVGWLLLIAAVIAGGCSDQAEKRQTTPEVAKLLRMVPVDAPYVSVLARKKKLPPLLVDKMLQSQNLSVERRKYGMDTALDGWRAAGILDRDLAEKLRQLSYALIEETAGKYSAEGWRSLGMEPNPHGVLYGLGIFPVFWQEIADQEKLNAFLERVETRSGLIAEKRHWKSQAYRYLALGPVSALVAVREGYLVLAVLPAGKEAELLPRVFGMERPQQSLADGKFARMAQERGFPGYGEGYLDTLEMLKAVRKAVEQGELPQWLPSDCQGLAEGVARNIPLLSFGLTGVSEHRWQFSVTVEAVAEITSYLQKIPAVVPGLGENSRALLNMGAGVNIPRLRDAINSSLRYVIKSGKGCSLIDEELLTKVIQGVSMGLNPMLAGIQGFNMNLDALEVDPETMKPKKLEGQILLAAKDPSGMLGILSSVVPELTQTAIPTDGTPVTLPLGDKLPVSTPVFVAVKGEALAAARGDEARAKVRQALDAPVSHPSPLFALSFDLSKVLPLILLLEKQFLHTQEQTLQDLEALAAGGEADDESLRDSIQSLKETVEQLRRNQENAQEMFAEIVRSYRRGGTWIYVTDHGLELRLIYDLKE
ncbi:hypothetical protein [Thiolapillus sp.]